MARLADGESISSWLIRSAIYSRFSGDSVAAYEILEFIKRKERCSDVDYDLSANDLEFLSRFVEFEIIAVLERCRPPSFWYMEDYKKRSSFCAQCILESLPSLKIPVWNTQWSEGWYVVCSKHRIPMITLLRSNRFLHLEDRHRNAFKLIMSRSSRRHWAIEEPNEPWQDPPIESFKADSRSVFLDILSNLAWITQSKIQSLIMNSDDGAREELKMVLDLVRVLLRKHTRTLGVSPYAFQLAGYARGRIPRVLNTDIPVDFDDLVEGAEQIDDALLRMSALALCARFIYVEDADELWAELVALGRQSGILIPSTLGWLTATAIGSSEAPVLEWYRECILSYPEGVQNLCRRFLDSPVSPRIIPLS